mgnify:CR=1 FL=1
MDEEYWSDDEEGPCCAICANHSVLWADLPCCGLYVDSTMHFCVGCIHQLLQNEPMQHFGACPRCNTTLVCTHDGIQLCQFSHLWEHGIQRRPFGLLLQYLAMSPANYILAGLARVVGILHKSEDDITEEQMELALRDLIALGILKPAPGQPCNIFCMDPDLHEKVAIATIKRFTTFGFIEWTKIAISRIACAMGLAIVLLPAAANKAGSWKQRTREVYQILFFSFLLSSHLLLPGVPVIRSSFYWENTGVVWVTYYLVLLPRPRKLFNVIIAMCWKCIDLPLSTWGQKCPTVFSHDKIRHHLVSILDESASSAAFAGMDVDWKIFLVPITATFHSAVALASYLILFRVFRSLEIHRHEKFPIQSKCLSVTVSIVVQVCYLALLDMMGDFMNQ